MLEEAAVAYFKVLAQDFPGDAEENCETFQSSGSKIKPDISRIWRNHWKGILILFNSAPTADGSVREVHMN